MQRWVKFVKYLREFGWEPIVYSPQKDDYPIIDNSLFNEVPKGIEHITGKIKEPSEYLNKLTGKKNNKQSAGFLDTK